MWTIRPYGILLPALLAATPAAADVRTFPGAAPCNGTLQGCIDGADPGDVIEIATNTAMALQRQAFSLQSVILAGREWELANVAKADKILVEAREQADAGRSDEGAA